MRRLAALSGLCILILGLLCNGTAFAAGNGADAPRFSQANQLLFMSNHLRNVQVPVKLSYRLQQSGSKDDFADHIDLTIDSDQGDDGKHVHISYLSGDRSRYIPDIDNAHGNPVIMMFLQHDVVAMARDTGGSWRYFQKRIKLALEHASRVEKTRVDYDGHQVDARKIVIVPFAESQEHRDDMGRSLDKRYVFTLSDEVPGGVLEIHAETPGAAGKQGMTEELRIQSVDHRAVPTKNDDAAAA